MKKTMLVRCLFFFLFMGLIMISPLQSFADYLDLGNTASDSTYDFSFVSGVNNPAGAPVALVPADPLAPPLAFVSGARAVTNWPYYAATDPGGAFASSTPGSSSFTATGLSDPEPIVSTQATVASDGTWGNALAQAFFFQEFVLGGAGDYTYSYLTSFNSTYFATDGKPASGYSEAQYGLGWWDPATSLFVPDNFKLSDFVYVPIGKTDVFEGHYGSITYDFDSDSAPVNGALPAFYAYSESFAKVPEPATMLLLGLGLMGVAGIRRKFKG
jgi:hypothetical protein